MNNFYLGEFRKLLLALAIASLAVIPIGQAVAQVALPYGASISQATAEKMTAVGVGYAIKQKWRLAYLSLPRATTVTGGVQIIVDGVIFGGQSDSTWAVEKLGQI
jgi:hypothetical protein